MTYVAQRLAALGHTAPVKRTQGLRKARCANTYNKLTPDDIPLIRALMRSGMRDREIAEKFEVGQAAINRVRHRVTWSHIP